MINRVKVEINGAKYIIATPEKESSVHELAKDLDNQVKQLLQSSERISLNDALVLCALNYADAYKKSEDSSDHMRNQLTDYLEDASKARNELDEAKREIDRLTRRLQMLGDKSL